MNYLAEKEAPTCIDTPNVIALFHDYKSSDLLQYQIGNEVHTAAIMDRRIHNTT